MGGRDHLFKVLVVGDAAVGKTSLVQRYSQDSFSKHYKSTVGGETSPLGRGTPAGGQPGAPRPRVAPGQEAGPGSCRQCPPVCDGRVPRGCPRAARPARADRLQGDGAQV